MEPRERPRMESPNSPQQRPENEAVQSMENDAKRALNTTTNAARRGAGRAIDELQKRRQADTGTPGPKTKENVRGAQGQDGTPKTRDSVFNAKTRQSAVAGRERVKEASKKREAIRYRAGRKDAARKASARVAGDRGRLAVKSGLRGRVKQKEKTVKAAGRAMKASKQLKTAKVAKKVVVNQAARRVQIEMARRALSAARQALKLALQVAKLIIKALIKAAMAIGKAIAAIASACWPVLLILLAVGIVAIIFFSPFGIFQNEENEDENSALIRTVVQQINAEYQDKMDEIQEANTWDILELEPTGPHETLGGNWKDVLAVFAVKTTTSEGGMDVMTMDEARIAMLRAVFWDMNELAHRIETRQVEQPILDDDGEPTEEMEAVSKEVLVIVQHRRSAMEQAEIYQFDPDQNAILQELMSGEYDGEFRKLIAGSIGTPPDGGTGVVAEGFYIWPTEYSNVVSSTFGYRPGVGYGDDHYGIDIAAGYGTPILAAADGTVITPETHFSYGLNVVIQHAEGNVSQYAHMSESVVKPGDKVKARDVIGYVGNSGISFGAHLHFETRVGGQHVNPLIYFDDYTLS